MLTAIDETVAQWFADHRIDVLDDVTLWLADVSELLGVLAAVGVIWVCVAVWFGGWRPMLQVVIVLAAVNVLTSWMKPVIDRPRPSGGLALTYIGGSAMPSSHALITSSIVVAVVMADWWGSARLRRAAVVIGVVGCLLVGLGMVYMGAHWLTDVLAGWALGVGLTWPLMRTRRYGEHPRPALASSRSIIRPSGVLMSDTSPAGTAQPPSSVRRVVVASLIGTSLEWYDFFIYGTAAALVFGQLFFPSFDPLVGTLLAFATYAVGFVARPLGGVVFGHYGDKLGRKNVLVVTLLIMGIATFVIGLLPTLCVDRRVGPVLLVALRFLQGLGLGGEWGGAVLMTLESGAAHQRGLNASWPQVGVPIGLLLANGVLSLMGAVTSDSAFLVLGVAGSVPAQRRAGDRRAVDPADDRREPAVPGGRAQDSKAKAPILDVLRLYPSRVLLAIGARIGVDVAFYTFVLFITTYVGPTWICRAPTRSTRS